MDTQSLSSQVNSVHTCRCSYMHVHLHDILLFWPLIFVYILLHVSCYSPECAFDGLAQLGQLGFGNTSAVLWWNVFALVMYAMVCMLLAYVVLRLIKKEK